MKDEIALRLDRVARLYGRTAALRGISLRLEAGETLALLGPNGSGKTTLLKIVAGAIAPSVGTGSIFGLDFRRDRLQLRETVGLLASETYLYEDLTAMENLRFAAVMSGAKPRAADLREMLRLVGLDSNADDRVRSFSSGMRRRLALGRTLLLRPRLLLLDEPYNSLDAAGADLVDRIVRETADEGRAVVLATHDAERALQLADRVAVLHNGVLQYSGPAAAYRMDHAQFVG